MISGTRSLFRSASTIKVGSKLPEATLHRGSPNTHVNTLQHFTPFKRAVIFGVPGAFTPGCSKTHLPGFVSAHSELQRLGVDHVACISVNDAFVMDAWGKANGADGNVEMLADPSASFVSACGLSFDATPVLGNVRSKRFSMVVEHGIVKALNVEPNGTGLTCTLASNVVEDLKKQLGKK
jgi:2-Cys peroxiredoxin 5